MGISLKLITNDDLDLICEWHKDHVKINFPDSKYKKKAFKDKLETHLQCDEDKMWLVWEDKKKIGFLWLEILYDYYKDCKYCNLHYIHLIPEARGKGYGKWLLKKTDEWAKENGAKEIRLGTSASNEIAINAYKKSGYTIKRVLMEKKYDRRGKKIL